MPKWITVVLLPLVALSTSVIFVGASTEASAQERCLVADPTGTPLNVRVAPNGHIIQTLVNGVLVAIFRRSSLNGKEWVYVGRPEDRVPIGWVYRDYLNCNVQDDPQLHNQEAAPSKLKPREQPSSTELSGTGFFIAPQYILTNNHVIRDCGRNPIRVSYPDRKPENAFLSGQDETNDLALLQTELPNLAVASFHFAPRIGESVGTYGFPLSGLLSTSGSFTLGSVTSLAGPNNDTRVLQISTPIQPGNSGGPLLDMSGSVIGVVEYQLNALLMLKVTGSIPQNVNFAIQSPMVVSFLRSKRISPSLAEAERKTLNPPEVADLARAFAVQIMCQSTEPSGPSSTERPSHPSQPVPSLVESSLGPWAIGEHSNCEVPSKSYFLGLGGGETIVWRNGIGSTDIERIVFSGEDEFRTITLQSVHKSGNGVAVGTSWIYSRNGLSRIRVQQGSRSFQLTRCR